METDHRAGQSPTTRRVLLGALLVVGVALAWVLQLFLGAILWGVILGLLFAPVFQALLGRLGPRPNLAAALTVLLVVILLVIPFGFIAGSLAVELAAAVERLRSGQWNLAEAAHRVFDALPGWVLVVLDRFGLAEFDVLQARITAALARSTQFIAGQVFNIGQNSFEFVLHLCITLYLAFFLIRDGQSLAAKVRRAIMLPRGHADALMERFATVVRATVKGNLVVAVVQGSLGGLAFGFLGVSGAVLWGTVMAFLSMVPAVGASLVWAPVALYLFATGAVLKALALVAWGVLVIGLVDNLLRPILVGKDTGLPDYVVLMTTLGGLAAFGLNGFVLGPMVAAMFLAVWDLYTQSHETASQKPAAATETGPLPGEPPA